MREPEVIDADVAVHDLDGEPSRAAPAQLVSPPQEPANSRQDMQLQGRLYKMDFVTALSSSVPGIETRWGNQCDRERAALELPFHAHLGQLAQRRRGFFAILTKHGASSAASSKDVVDLQAAINRFVADHNQQPKPFVWTADPDKIIAAANRGYQVSGFNPLGK